jgi:transglutaminase-like putative cysteine protease
MHSAYGQNFSRAFGVIGNEEFELKEYILDTNAAAVVLFDLGKSHFEEGDHTFNVIYERTTRIKIFNEAGIKWAEVEIPYYQEENIKEKVFDIEAFAYNIEKGEMVKTPFDASNAFDEKVNNSWTKKKFAIPGVKAGTIIEYRYKIRSQYKFNLRDWAFQWRIPVVYSEYQVRMVPVYEYSFLYQGNRKFDVRESYEDTAHPRKFSAAMTGTSGQSYNDMVHTYGMRNVPAFVDEKYISSINDYIMKIDFQLSKINYFSGASTDIIATWDGLIEELLKHPEFGGAVKKAEKLTSSLLKSADLDKATEEEKFNMVMDYVKSTYNWDHRDGKYVSKPVSRLVEEKYGNSADLNLLTVGLLNGVGIDAHPVLISTRENGKIKYDYPYSHFFDYVIIAVTLGDQQVLCDATDPLGLNNRIPARCINEKGLVVRKGLVQWVKIECSFVSEINTTFAMTFKPEMEMDVAVRMEATEYDALDYRMSLSDDVEDIRDDLESAGFTMDTASVKVENLAEKEKPYTLHFIQAGTPEIVNDKIYLSPFLDWPLAENPFKENARNYPIDMNYPMKRSFISTITIPEGYHVDFKPDDVKISNPLFDLNYVITVSDKVVTVLLDYTFRQAIYPASDFGKIKAYFNGIVRKGNEKVVFSK